MNRKAILMNLLRAVLLVGILFWMTVIFGFSSADAVESQSTSDKITKVIVDSFYQNYEEMSALRQQELWNNISFVVRKTGHFGEYTILGLFITTLLLTFSCVRKNKKYILTVIVMCCVYAITDEIHQGFVDGRSPKVMDVCIDTAGGACGMLCVYVIYWMKGRRKK